MRMGSIYNGAQAHPGGDESLDWDGTLGEGCWGGVLPPDTPEGLQLAAEEINGNIEPGFLIYGAPVGSDLYCAHQLQLIAEKIVQDAQQTVELLTGERQSLWSAFRCSIMHRFDYWLQMSYPSVVEPIASWLDTELGECYRPFNSSIEHKLTVELCPADSGDGKRQTNVSRMGCEIACETWRLWYPLFAGHVKHRFPWRS